MSYGKYWVTPITKNVICVLLDEIHVKNEQVLLVSETLKLDAKMGKHGQGKIPLVSMTATGTAIGADRDIGDISHDVPDDKKNSIQIDNDFWMDKNYIRPGRKHLIFVPTKRPYRSYHRENGERVH